MSLFHQRLIELRKEAHETQTDVSVLTGKARSSIQGYETEGKEPPYDILLLLAEHYGVTTDYLLGRSNVRGEDDAVFVNDTRAFARTFSDLPPDLRHIVASAFDSIYLLLFRDMRFHNTVRLSLYSKLFALLQRSRAKIRVRVENENSVDPLFVSEIMDMQSALKTEASSLFDRLLQADMGLSGEKDRSVSPGSSAV
ncbi:MAG: helix-turn-helix transcriptional regulator [Lachnospiraceae bacterium]|nr:helix-turn-helix transcriptional regulator [Lachnospiraceae bacterium]